jgi:hypothetical protein
MLMPPLVVGGSARLEGERLVVDIEGHGEFPVDDHTIEMEVEYSFDGKRR